jgi:hypothetical protein
MEQLLPEHDDNDEEKIEKMVTMTVAAAKGIVPLVQVALPLAQIANSPLAPPEARELAKSLSQLLKGERDPIALVQNLSPELAERVWEALEQIEAPLPEPEGLVREGLSFEQLVEKVAEACTGELMLWQQLWRFTEELAADERLPADIRALGRALRKILAGERQKHVLDEVSAQHRWALEQLLDWLNAQSISPGPAE